ncbi:MAG TPA: hypothetical protein VNJ09_11480 [Chthonomonadales bacterium]|nr:hypothetical protein [Chthonomonadales bacterium]
MAEAGDAPKRVIAGQATRLSRTMHDIRYDEPHDELWVPNPFANAVLVFRGGARGEEAPIRIIQGPKTQLAGPTRLDLDLLHDEVFVSAAGYLVAFPRTARGDIPPLRMIRHRDIPSGDGNVAVDPINNVVVVGSRGRDGASQPEGKLLIFNRTDNGNVEPIRVISGPNVDIVRITQLQTYPPKGWIIATMPGRSDVMEPHPVYVGIWHVHDNGNVPPRWKLGGQNTLLKKPRGVVLNAKYKELIVADMRLNAVLTYYFPELF